MIDRAADDLQLAVFGEPFIQQRRAPVDLVEVVFERVGDVLCVALQHLAAPAPIVGFAPETHAPYALAKRMIEEEAQRKQDDRQLDLPDFIQMGDAQRVIGERRDEPDPQRQKHADRHEAALPVVPAVALRPEGAQQDQRGDEAEQHVVPRDAQAEHRVALERRYPIGRKTDAQADGRKPDDDAQEREEAGLVELREVKCEHHHAGNGQQIESRAQDGIHQRRARLRPDAGGNQRRGEAVIQIFLERADAEHHAAGEAPLVELVARVGQQNQRKGRPNHKREHKQMRSRKRSPIRDDAAQKIKHVFFLRFPHANFGQKSDKGRYSCFQYTII